MWTGWVLSSVVFLVWLAVHGSLGEVAVGQGAAFNRGERRMLLAHVVQRFLDFLVFYFDFRMVGAQLLVALDLDLGHDLEAGLEAQRLAIMNMQVGDARLGDRNHSQLFGFLAEVARDQRLDHIALQVFFKSLPDDRRRHVPGAEPGQARHLLIFLDQHFSFAGDFFGGDFDRNLALDAVFLLFGCFRRTHNFLLGAQVSQIHTPLILSVKREAEKRQAREPIRHSHCRQNR